MNGAGGEGGGAPVVILAVGNPSRGDDALGPLLLERLRDWLDAAGLRPDFELIEDFQLQVEHALDLAGRRLALFIDAGQGTPAPYAFQPVCAGARESLVRHSTHALSPEAVLAVLPRIGETTAPAAFVLAVRGERFELGEAPSEPARVHADAAMRLLQVLCRNPEVEAWEREAYNRHKY